MDVIVEIVRRIGRQLGQNTYYRTCYTLLNISQDLILEASNKLLDLCYSDEFRAISYRIATEEPSLVIYSIM